MGTSLSKEAYANPPRMRSSNSYAGMRGVGGFGRFLLLRNPEIAKPFQGVIGMRNENEKMIIKGGNAYVIKPVLKQLDEKTIRDYIRRQETIDKENDQLTIFDEDDE